MELGEYDHRAVEAAARELWESHDIYAWDKDGFKGAGPVFSVDTPPPYVSAAHLHVGHAMSYSQPDFIVRYRRMRGERVFYPIGFDDNGLPTERYVEQAYGVRAADMPRAEFVALCLAETSARPNGTKTCGGGSGCPSTGRCFSNRCSSVSSNSTRRCTCIRRRRPKPCTRRSITGWRRPWRAGWPPAPGAGTPRPACTCCG